MFILFCILGVIALLLVGSVIARNFAPQSMINGYMSEEMLEAICPEIYKNIFKKKEKEK
jgi:hypothetical protein